MNFPDAVKSVYSQYVTFSGRSLRSEYWYFILFYLIVSIALSAVGLAVGVPGILENVFGLASFLPSLAVAIRRLHDVDRSGWWVLIPLTIIGIIPYLYWMIKEGDSGENRFGPAPTPSA